MRTIQEISAALHATLDPEQEWSRLARLASELETHPDAVHALPVVLALYERFPKADFGIPGPLAHAIEKHHGEEYVRLLTESLERKPTEQTLFLAERMLNARDQFAPNMVTALQSVAMRPDVDRVLRDEATRIIARHSCPRQS